jgi:hypothetical protein
MGFLKVDDQTSRGHSLGVLISKLFNDPQVGPYQRIECERSNKEENWHVLLEHIS